MARSVHMSFYYVLILACCAIGCLTTQTFNNAVAIPASALKSSGRHLQSDTEPRLRAGGRLHQSRPPWSSATRHSGCTPSRLYTSPHNGRKYLATVMGLADDAHVYKNNASRLPIFQQSWAGVWPGLHIRHQPTFLNHADLFAYGIAAGFYLAIAESLLYLRATNQTCDYHLFFEDDAKPFNNTTWPPQTADNNLDARLDELDSLEGTALFLGGHAFKDVNKSAAAAAAARPYGGITAATMSYGAYALLVKCSSLAFVAERLHAHLRVTSGKTQVFERVLWGAFLTMRDQGNGTGPYASAPLLVDHVPGFSATFQKDGQHIPLYTSFEGKSTFW